MKSFKKCKYGMFIHHILREAHYADGSKVQTIDEMADAFDTEGFADSLSRMGVEYIIYTAWHFAVQPLFPSKVSEKWRPGNCPQRDLLGDIIDCVNKRGIHVILYTHPRDGHDFSEDDKEITGWGRDNNSEPNSDTFDYKKWNAYMGELYSELAERYADRITGYYTDGSGPKDPQGFFHPNLDHQVVDYVNIQNIMKSANPALVSFQNYYDDVYTQEYGNTETYGEYLRTVLGNKNSEKWQCTKKTSTTIMPFCGWLCSDTRTGESVQSMALEDMIRYIMFNGSCCDCGNVAFASGTFAEGNLWSIGVEETLSQLKNELSRFEESFMDAIPSRCYPTMPGSNLEDNNYRFWMTDTDHKYEYLHCFEMPKDGIITWDLAENGVKMICPEVISGEMSIESFECSENGYRLTLTGTPDRVDTVIRFRCEGEAKPLGYEWINCSDKRMAYFGTWRCNSDLVYDPITAIGCYEREAFCATGKDSSLYLCYEGRILELYCVIEKDYGSADVYIDGVFRCTIDQNSDIRQAHVLCYRTEDLFPCQHILQLYTKNDKMFTVDAVKVIH